jgi:hypothetical protein
VVRDNSGAGWPDDMAHCWYTVESGTVTLCHESGKPLDDGKHRHVLLAYEDPKGAAERLLKARAGVSNEFKRQKIQYPKLGMI